LLCASWSMFAADYPQTALSSIQWGFFVYYTPPW
jgi:hypothetical protein